MTANIANFGNDGMRGNDIYDNQLDDKSSCGTWNWMLVSGGVACVVSSSFFCKEVKNEQNL